MESGGIVRRIDELGRIVIPKELRRTMRLSVGDEMEILSNGENVILKKYNKYESIKEVVRAVAKSLARATDADVVVVDLTSVVISLGKHKRKLEGLKMGGELEKAVSARRETILHGDDLKDVFENSNCDCCYLVFEPITQNGDNFGGMALLLDTLPSDIARAYLKFCTELIGASLA